MAVRVNDVCSRFFLLVVIWLLCASDRRARITLPGVEGRPAFGVSLGKCSGVSADVNSSWEDCPLCYILPLVSTTFSLIHYDPPLLLLWLLRQQQEPASLNINRTMYVCTVFS